MFLSNRRRLTPFNRKKQSAYVNLRRKRNWAVILTAAISLLFFFMISGSILALVSFAVFSKDLPSPDKLTNRKIDVSTRIYDRNGKLLFDVYKDVNRSIVKLSDIPKPVIDATLATEDAEYYQHGGFDILGILRAFKNIVLYHQLQGGSTITQQLVKTALLSNERSVIRKIKELVLSIEIERIYNKDQILQIYFNEIPYGGTAWGIAAASELYFGKNVKDLTLGESALLAGLPQSPTYYSPFGPEPQRARERQRYVLYLMENKGWVDKDGKRYFLSKEEADAARNQVLDYAKPGQTINAPHFSLYVKSLLTQKYGQDMVESGGLQVTTSLDLDLQNQLQDIVKSQLDKIKALKVGNGALVAMDPKTGEVLSMVGSKDYFGSPEPAGCTPGKDCTFEGNFNAALDALRQPGSSFKPITYATAFEKGLTPATLIMDVPTSFPGADGQAYSPVNYDGKFHGPLSLRNALGSSVNIAAVKLLKIVGIPSVISKARQLGITTLTDPARYGLSLTLGGGEVPLIQMTQAYAAFANQGKSVTPLYILEVKDSHGNVLEENHPVDGQKVFSPEVSYLISNVLSDDSARVLAFGPNSLLNIPGFSVAVKTGTSNDKRDNWTIGYTPSIVIGVWVGNNDNSPMDQRLASGITGASPIWNLSMKAYLKGKKDEPFVKPDNIVEMDVDSLTGMLPYAGQPTKKEVFIQGTQPTTTSDMYQTIKVCRVDNKIADQNCINQNQYDEKTFVVFHDPALQSEFQQDIQNFINSADGFKDNPIYHPPTETSTM
ncbi:MAG: transglycosylase domain-containing protein [Patescibacteria group bacterium]|nr:transglycosylase domain-containing protein [Patescibacteria group bacterium]